MGSSVMSRRAALRRFTLAVPLAATLLRLSGASVGMAEILGSAHMLWKQRGAVDFAAWQLAGVGVGPDGAIELRDAELDAQGRGVGAATGPVVQVPRGFRELIVSWNASTGEDGWIDVSARASLAEGWSRWYVLGVWSTGDTAHRHSVDGQDDAAARVLTDTLALESSSQQFQVRVGLHGPARVSIVTAVATDHVAYAPGADEGAARGRVLDVPVRSQMVYPGGGEVWCSPTSTSMVMAYWARVTGDGSMDRTVPDAAVGTYDPVYRGNGNWPFNTAFAASHGLIAYVTRLASVAEMEPWIQSGVPLVASVAWQPGELPQAPIRSTNGHLLVVVGVAEDGAVVVNEPAADPRLGQPVRRTYPRRTFERLWQMASHGAVYVIYPANWPVPN
ncbi:MAG: C39 family peptidase [Chloroflexota bacterium]